MNKKIVLSNKKQVFETHLPPLLSPGQFGINLFLGERLGLLLLLLELSETRRRFLQLVEVDSDHDIEGGASLLRGLQGSGEWGANDALGLEFAQDLCRGPQAGRRRPAVQASLPAALSRIALQAGNEEIYTEKKNMKIRIMIYFVVSTSTCLYSISNRNCIRIR